MTRFSHLGKLDIAGRTAWLELPEIAPKARIQGHPATDVNKPYFNAMLKRTGKQIRHLARGGRMTAEHFRDNRDVDVALYPIHVFTAWDGIPDDDEELVPYSKDDCKDFMLQLAAKAPYLVDRIRNFFGQPESFLDDDEEEAPDPVEIAENSLAGSSGS